MICAFLELDIDGCLSVASVTTSLGDLRAKFNSIGGIFEEQPVLILIDL